jgi:cobalt-zinc-cadmium efflux system outer membrane protein
MKKITLWGLILVAHLHAVTYEELLNQALENNLELQLSNTQVQQTELLGRIETRLENPNVEIEASNFSSKRILRNNQFGARIGATQSLLLPSVKEDKKRLTQTQIEVKRQSLKLSKSDLIYRFNLQYLRYKEAVNKSQLQEEALKISKKIVAVTQGRFSAGTIAKSELLRVQIEQAEVLSQLKAFSLQSLKEKNSLLRLANVERDAEVQSTHLFFQSSTTSMHPLLELTQKREKVAQASLAVASHNIEKISLFSELEAEPDQDIFRVGVSIPFPLFNKKSEEKQLAKIALSNQKLALASQQRALNLELPQLQEEIAVQEALRLKYEKLVDEQKKLLTLYQKGYAIAKVNLLKLSTLKKELLLSKEQLLETSLAIEKNTIKINYLQGAYNE